MSAGRKPDIDSLADGNPEFEYVRRVPGKCVTSNLDTGEIELIPQVAFVFDPDLSIHQHEMIVSAGSTVEVEYDCPANGAIVVPVKPMVSWGALLKSTPTTTDPRPILGDAHHSLFGVSRTPSKTDKARMRDHLMKDLVWLHHPAA